MQKITFNIEKFDLIEESQNSQLSKVRMWIVREGNNRHNLPIYWEAITSAKKTLVGKPVLCKYNKYKDGFEGHEEDEIPVGVFLNDFEIYEEELDGAKWLVADAFIWKAYFPEIIEVFRKQNGVSNVSMEIEVLEREMVDGLECIKLFAFLGVTLIGVSPAIPDAKAKVIEFSELIKKTHDLLDKKEGDKLVFSLNSEQILEIIGAALKTYKYQDGDYECNKYWPRTYDTEFVYVWDYEQGANFRMKYILEDMTATVDVESAEEVIDGGFILKNKPEENAEFALPEKEKMTEFSESFKDKFSLISYSAEFMFCYACEEKKFVAIPYACKEEKMEANFENLKKFKFECVACEDESEDEVFAFMQSMFGKDTVALEETKAKMSEMQTEHEKCMSELNNRNETLSAENAKFKEVEIQRCEAEKNQIVECALKEIEDSLNTDQIDELRKDAQNFSLENIDAWKNKGFALAFASVKKIDKKNFTRIQFPIDTKPKSKSKWDEV